jgi:autonomous glycyl radical cofactor GrcA
MDEKEKIDSFLNSLDSFMENGGSHLKVNEHSKDILLNGTDEAEKFSQLAQMSNTCPECASIPNISDTDDNLN